MHYHSCPWFIPHHLCTGPHVDATNVCLELMLQPLSMLIPFFGGHSLPHFSSSYLACQAFSWIPQLPSASLVLTSSIIVTWPSHHIHDLNKIYDLDTSYVFKEVDTRQCYCAVFHYCRLSLSCLRVIVTGVIVTGVQVKCVVETRDQQHCDELEMLLRTNYTNVNFGPNVI